MRKQLAWAFGMVTLFLMPIAAHAAVDAYEIIACTNSGGTWNYTTGTCVMPHSVPEPSALVLFAAGIAMLGIGAIARHRRSLRS
jgi:PEP-CTERM motif-containing protein